MKNLLLTSVFLIFAPGLLNSQVQFGLSLGTGITKFGGKDARDWGSADADASFQPKIHAGILVLYPLNDKVDIESGLYYSGAGTAYSGTIGSDDITYRKQLNYLALPVHFHYKLSEKISAFVGPRLGFLLSAKVVNDAAQAVLDYWSLEEKEDAKDNYKATDFGLDFGLGYMVNEKIGVKFSYDLGLAKIATYDEYSVIEALPLKSSLADSNSIVYDVKNRGIKLSLSYLF